MVVKNAMVWGCFAASGTREVGVNDESFIK